MRSLFCVPFSIFVVSLTAKASSSSLLPNNLSSAAILPLNQTYGPSSNATSSNSNKTLGATFNLEHEPRIHHIHDPIPPSLRSRQRFPVGNLGHAIFCNILTVWRSPHTTEQAFSDPDFKEIGTWFALEPYARAAGWDMTLLGWACIWFLRGSIDGAQEKVRYWIMPDTKLLDLRAFVLAEFEMRNFASLEEESSSSGPGDGFVSSLLNTTTSAFTSRHIHRQAARRGLQENQTLNSEVEGLIIQCDTQWLGDTPVYPASLVELVYEFLLQLVLLNEPEDKIITKLSRGQRYDIGPNRYGARLIVVFDLVIVGDLELDWWAIATSMLILLKQPIAANRYNAFAGKMFVQVEGSKGRLPSYLSAWFLGREQPDPPDVPPRS
ncbi:uncharacterized protein KY384_005662 [Bacidia gigantensis]|uniref:uncharacterized protein n=1 Tax=Bacidia gigantensis TaxID=2732470 RepID=UPI001D037E1E|nr:uncharacterized protein KY384_005662 [Bacidia gigantensis]KAG8530179.1 hypothetical protein KY384_005662 [Bacidia gigantensis]